MSASTCVSYFINDLKCDLKDPATSDFVHNVDYYRRYYQEFSEEFDLQVESLQKFKKCCKMLHDSSREYYKLEQELIFCLDHIAGVENSIQNNEPDISMAWLKFCVIFKDLSALTKTLCQSIKNNLIFPAENLLKSADFKDRGDLKKFIEKAFKDYDLKRLKCEKIHKNSNSGHLLMSKSDTAENLMTERTLLQYELCKFFDQVVRIRSKSGPELLQRLVDFYHTQESFYREGLRTVEEFRIYVENLVEKLTAVKKSQDDERRQLKELTEELRKSHYINQDNNIDSTPVALNELMSNSAIFDENEASTSLSNIPTHEDDPLDFSGYLFKKSANKVHKSWLKRKCRTQNGSFIMWHSDESRLPVTINLLICQTKPDKSDSKCFQLISPERTYHFQAEDEDSARNWLSILTKNRKQCQIQAFRDDSLPSSLRPKSHVSRSLVDLLMQKLPDLPANRRCCDCDSTKDVTWISVNLGGIYCIECSGVHRDLGVQISRIQSLSLDYADIVTLLVPISIGNATLNEIYESKQSEVQSKSRLTHRANARKNFILAKYVEKKFVDKSFFRSKDELISYFAGAVRNGSVKSMLRAFACSVDLDCILDMEKMENALFIACQCDVHGSHLAAIQFLIQNGADVNRVNLSGDTILHCAVRLNKPDIVNIISLGRNVRLSFLNAVEETPKQLAERLEHDECKQLHLIALVDNCGASSSCRDTSYLMVSALRDFMQDCLCCSRSKMKLASLENGDRSMLGYVKPPHYLLDSAIIEDSNDSNPIDRLAKIVQIGIPCSTGSVIDEESVDISLSQSSPLSTCSGRLKTLESTTSDTSPCNTNKKHVPAGAKLVLPFALPSPRSKENDVTSKDEIFILSSESTSSPPRLKHNSKPTVKEEDEHTKPIPRQRFNSKPLVKRCRALYDCVADRSDELSFNCGDLIVVTKNFLKEENENWLEGFVESRPDIIGLFPVTFVTFEK